MQNVEDWVGEIVKNRQSGGKVAHYDCLGCILRFYARRHHGHWQVV